mmetsp:Transcript_34405/g.83234  ORF Transcript_34405/g.83234 Transcript_34405/m.83234 type:complete len:201 (-) Transcript_34405:169-771(-)
MPTVTVFGEVIGATGFKGRSHQAEYKFLVGEKWKCSDGTTSGTTFVADTENLTGELKTVWNHPVQVQFEAEGIKGWPKLKIQVNVVDEHERTDVVGYGFCHVPMSPGTHKLEVYFTRPKGDFWSDVASSFVGGYPKYKDSDSITKSKSLPPAHQVITTGVVNVELSVWIKGVESKLGFTSLGTDKASQNGDTNQGQGTMT